MITIGIPCYNQAEYLPDAIESVIGQPLESDIIVVDDGSTDKTREVASSYPVRLISQVNKGLPSARNTIIMNAKCDYIWFLDADDMLMDGALPKMEKVIEETGADIVAPSFKCFGVQNNTVILNKDLSFKDFRDANRIGYFSAVKKSVLQEVGGFSPRMVWGFEDYALWINLLRLGKKLVTIQEPLVMYRTKEHSMIHDANKHREELMAQIKKDNPELYED